MALVALSCGPFLTVLAPVLAGTPESEVQDGSALLVLNWTPGRPAASSRGRGPNDPSRRAWRAACGSGGCRSAVVSGARGVRSSPGRVALGMPPSPPGLGFLICEVGVTVGPPPPDARGGYCDNGSRSKPGRVARLRARPLLPEGRAGPCGGGRTRAGTALRVQLRPVGDTGTRTGPSSRCQGTAGLGRQAGGAESAEGQGEAGRAGARERGPAPRLGGCARPAAQSRGHRTCRWLWASCALRLRHGRTPVASSRGTGRRLTGLPLQPSARGQTSPRTDQPAERARRAVSLRRLAAETPASKRPARQQA